MTEEATHWPCWLDPDMIGSVATETRVLELGGVRVEEEASMKEKDGSVPLYKGCEYQTPPPGPQSLPIPKELYPDGGWVTHVRVEKNPLKRGDTISAWIRHANKTTS